MANTPIKSATRQLDFEAVQDLHSAEQIVTRETLRKVPDPARHAADKREARGKRAAAS